MRALAPVALMGLLGSAAWHGADRMLTQRALQSAADRWLELRTCLVGEGASETRPSEQVRFIRLGHAPANAGGPDAWPARCLPYAAGLDRALASGTLRRRLSDQALPSAEDLVRQGLPTARGGELDLLFAAMRRADLPAGRRAQPVPAAPSGVRPLLGAEDLGAFAELDSLDAVSVDLDSTHGRVLRLLVREPGGVVLCRLNDGPRDERWRTVSCQRTPVPATGELRLAGAEPEAADLIYRREGDEDGFFDAASGLRVWRPADPLAQAVVAKDGTTAVLYNRGDEPRLVRLEPGKAPSNKRLTMSRRARARLLDDALLWWEPDEGGEALFARPLRNEKRWLGDRQRIGSVPEGARYLADCTAGYAHALVLGSPAGDRTRYTIVMREKGLFAKIFDLGVRAPGAELSCHGEAAMLWWQLGDKLVLERCTVEGCKASAGGMRIEAGEPPALAPLADRMVAVRRDARGPLMLRSATPPELASAGESLLLDDAEHGGIDARAMRLVASDGLALLMLHGRGGQVFLVRIAPGARVSGVRVVR